MPDFPSFPLLSHLAARVSSPVPRRWAYVSISAKQLWLLDGDTVLAAYPVGTGREPPSGIENSLGTPYGLHRIAECIGAGAPEGTVFESRVPLGHHSQVDPKLQRITSRILRLEGLEPGLNRGQLSPQGPCCDTFARYVYIHGVPFLKKMGTAFTLGCIVLHDPQMMELFEALERGSLVFIVQ